MKIFLQKDLVVSEKNAVLSHTIAHC